MNKLSIAHITVNQKKWSSLTIIGMYQSENTWEIDFVFALLEDLFKIYNLSGCRALWDQSFENDVHSKLTGQEII